MSLLAHTALLAQQAFGPLEGVGTALAGWAVDDPDRHRPKPPVVDGVSVDYALPKGETHAPALPATCACLTRTFFSEDVREDWLLPTRGRPALTDPAVDNGDGSTLTSR